MISRLKQWLALKLHPTYEPTPEELSALKSDLKKEVEHEFYADLDIQALFTEQEQSSLMQFVPVINLIVSFVVLLVMFTR